MTLTALLLTSTFAAPPPLPPAPAPGPRVEDHGEVSKSDWVRYSVKMRSPDVADVEYVFKDFTGQLFSLKFAANVESFYAAGHVFGAPPWLQGAFLESQRAQREADLHAHLMRVRNGHVGADPAAMVRYYDGFTRPIALQLVAELQRRRLDTRANRIAMALAFVQDLPYREVHDAGTHRQGILPAPEVLLDGYGDCDTKAIFFAGLMVAMVGIDDVVLLVNEDAHHALAAVAAPPGPGQVFITVAGRPFLVAEVAGPARIALGEKGSDSPDAFVIERLGEPAPARP